MSKLYGILIMLMISIPFVYAGSFDHGVESTLDSNLLHHYNFDTDANDALGLLNGTVSGAVLTTGDGGVQGEAYDFDGFNDWIGFGNSEFFDLNNSDYTWQIWLQGDVGAGTMDIIGQNGGGAGLYFFQVAGSQRISADYTGPNSISQLGTSMFLESKWSMWTVTWDHTTHEFRQYVNGSQAELNINDTADAEDIYLGSPGDNHAIGAYDEALGASGRNYGGLMDMYSTWDRVLTEQEILDSYDGGGGIDPSLGVFKTKYNGTFVGGFEYNFEINFTGQVSSVSDNSSFVNTHNLTSTGFNVTFTPPNVQTSYYVEYTITDENATESKLAVNYTVDKFPTWNQLIVGGNRLVNTEHHFVGNYTSTWPVTVTVNSSDINFTLHEPSRSVFFTYFPINTRTDIVNYNVTNANGSDTQDVVYIVAASFIEPEEPVLNGSGVVVNVNMQNVSNAISGFTGALIIGGAVAFAEVSAIPILALGAGMGGAIYAADQIIYSDGRTATTGLYVFLLIFSFLYMLYVYQRMQIR